MRDGCVRSNAWNLKYESLDYSNADEMDGNEFRLSAGSSIFISIGPGDESLNRQLKGSSARTRSALSHLLLKSESTFPSYSNWIIGRMWWGFGVYGGGGREEGEEKRGWLMNYPWKPTRFIQLFIGNWWVLPPLLLLVEISRWWGEWVVWPLDGSA